jgi:hypothetical protein
VGQSSTLEAATTSGPPQEGPSEASTSATEPPRAENVVVVQMTVTGIDYGLLIANSDLLSALRAACVGAVADAAGVEPSSVSVEFSQGSVVVTASITVPQDQTAAGVESTFTTWQDDSLVVQINGISGIDAVTNGEQIGVVGTSIVEGGGVAQEDGVVDSGSGVAGHVLCPLVASSLFFVLSGSPS